MELDRQWRGQARRRRIVDSAPFFSGLVSAARAVFEPLQRVEARPAPAHFRSLRLCQPRFRRPREFSGTEFGSRKNARNAQHTTGKSHRPVHGQSIHQHQATSSPPKLPATQPTNSSHQKRQPTPSRVFNTTTRRRRPQPGGPTGESHGSTRS